MYLLSLAIACHMPPPREPEAEIPAPVVQIQARPVGAVATLGQSGLRWVEVTDASRWRAAMTTAGGRVIAVQPGALGDPLLAELGGAGVPGKQLWLRVDVPATAGDVRTLLVTLDRAGYTAQTLVLGARRGQDVTRVLWPVVTCDAPRSVSMSGTGLTVHAGSEAVELGCVDARFEPSETCASADAYRWSELSRELSANFEVVEACREIVVRSEPDLPWSHLARLLTRVPEGRIVLE